MNNKRNWLENPTKTQFLISMMLYITSFTILLAALTNFFQGSIDFKRNYVLIFLNIPLFVLMIKTIKNFYGNTIKTRE